MVTKKHTPLGKGLGALLGAGSMAQTLEKNVNNDGLEIDINLLMPGEYQPRGKIHEADLLELADSIRAQGILQPVLARKKGHNRYEIIAGERRWRAAKLAGLTMIPVMVKEVPDENAMAMGLIENIQREDLNALEEAYALERLSKEFNLTHHQVAEAVGKSRTTVTNLLRLLTLTEEVKDLLLQKSLEVGHAKVLLSLKGKEQSKAAALIVAKGLSVRESERLIAKRADPLSASGKASAKSVDPDVKRLEKTLSEKLGAWVEIQQGSQGKGKIQIRYNSLDELDGILAHIQ